MPRIPPQAYRLAHRLLQLTRRVRKPRTLGVKVVVVADSQVILVRHCYGDQRWMLPGGGLRRTETVHECLRRELREETSVAVDADVARQAELLAVFESTIEDKNDLVIVPVLHLASTVPIEARNEIAEVRWAPLDALPDDLSSSTRAVLARIGQPTSPLGTWGL